MKDHENRSNTHCMRSPPRSTTASSNENESSSLHTAAALGLFALITADILLLRQVWVTGEIAEVEMSRFQYPLE